MAVWLRTIIPIAALIVPSIVCAQTTAAVTATCKDGTSFSGTTRRGACRGHGGVQSYNTPNDTTAPAAPTTTAAPVTPAPATSTPAPATSPTRQQQTSGSPTANISCPGDKVVWVNTKSHIFHAEGDRYFGHTKSGKFICQQQAEAEGDRATKSRH